MLKSHRLGKDVLKMFPASYSNHLLHCRKFKGIPEARWKSRVFLLSILDVKSEKSLLSPISLPDSHKRGRKKKGGEGGRGRDCNYILMNMRLLIQQERHTSLVHERILRSILCSSVIFGILICMYVL